MEKKLSLQVFSNKDANFSVTPILFDGKIIFLCDEVEKYLDYSNLANSVRTSSGLKEGVDYLTLTNGNLRELKDLLNRRGNTASVKIAPNVNSLIVLTESGFYAIAFRSKKEECIKFRLWITSEVLPELQKTGSYSVNEQPPRQIPFFQTIKNEAVAVAEIAKSCGIPAENLALFVSRTLDARYGTELEKALPIPTTPSIATKERQKKFYDTDDYIDAKIIRAVDKRKNAEGLCAINRIQKFTNLQRKGINADGLRSRLQRLVEEGKLIEVRNGMQTFYKKP